MAMKTTAAPRSCGLLIRNMQLLPRHHAPALARRISTSLPCVPRDGSRRFAERPSLHRIGLLVVSDGRSARWLFAHSLRDTVGGRRPTSRAGQPGAVAGIAALTPAELGKTVPCQ